MKKTKKIKLIPFETIERSLMKRPGFKKVHEDHGMEFTIIKSLIIARAKDGLTQRQLAERIGIPQSALARFESGRVNPTLLFLKKVVNGLGLRIAIL